MKRHIFSKCLIFSFLFSLIILPVKKTYSAGVSKIKVNLPKKSKSYQKPRSTKRPRSKKRLRSARKAVLKKKKEGPQKYFTYWGFGSSKSTYNWQNDEVSKSGHNRSSQAYDLFGIYRVLDNNKTFMGFVLNLIIDKFGLTADANSDHRMELNKFSLNFSNMHFFGKQVGSGFFLRGDMGLARLPVTTYASDERYFERDNVYVDKTWIHSSNEKPRIKFRPGGSVLVGMGWGFPAKQLKLLIGVYWFNAWTYHHNTVLKYGAESISVGVAF